MEALDLLTEDCWNEILKRVKDPKDLKSCSDTCFIFQEILRNKRREFLFGLLLPKILEYLPEPHYQRRELLRKCRLVCNSWNQAIEKLWNSKPKYSLEHRYWFMSGEQTEGFLQKFANHAGNPFLGRSVTLNLRSPLLFSRLNAEDPRIQPEENFHVRKLDQLLKRFGSEIWTVRLYASNLHDHLVFCKNVQTVLGHLANLRSLRLRFGIYSYVNDPREHLAELTSYIDANPFPDLPQLEHLHAQGENLVTMGPLLEKYSPQLKFLFLEDTRAVPENGLHMSNLDILSIRLDATNSLRGLRGLEAPQLRSLSLAVTVTPNIKKVVWPMDELFRNIEHLPIQELRIQIPDGSVLLRESGTISPEQRPSHGSISSVELSFPSGSVSFNLLSYCPKLRNVSINVFGAGPRPPRPSNGVAELLDVNELIGQVGYDLYQSNIWEKIPSLEYFRVRNQATANWREDEGTRIEYDKRKIENGEELVGEGGQ